MTLPTFLQQETEDIILARMLARVPDDLDKSEGSYIYDALAAASPEVAQIKIEMGNYLNRGFALTTFGEYLDLRCAEKGISRIAAVKATGEVTFTGTPLVVIPAGTVVATPADLVSNTISVEYVTAEEKIIGPGGTVNAPIQARISGTGGNINIPGVISILTTPISGIASVTNASTITGGMDIESDAALLERYLIKVQEPGTSGNKADYRIWAGEVAGVGNAVVTPLWNGRGTVKVYLLGIDKTPASADVVEDAQAYIDPNPGQGEGKAPIGATVTIVAATGIDINITATVTLIGSKTLAEVKTTFEAALVKYLAELAFSDDPTVRFVRIGSLLLDTVGVQDYSNLLVNMGTGNIVINTGEVGVKGTVTLS